MLFRSRTEHPNIYYLDISGKTYQETLDEDYSIYLSFRTKIPMKKVTKTFSSGLLVLKVEYDKPVQPDVEIVNG